MSQPSFLGVGVLPKFFFFSTERAGPYPQVQLYWAGRITTARVTIENFWARSGRELYENFLRTFTNFDRGTVDFRHMGVQVSRINTKVYGSESFGDLPYTLNTPSYNFSN
jgi:hypothetical protein